MDWGNFVDTLKRLSGLQTRKPATAQDRKAVRIAQQFALVAMRPNGETLMLRAMDCGATGMRVECPKSVARGETLKLALPASHARPSMSEGEAPSAKVAWARKKRLLPTFELGLAFVLETPEQRKGVAHFLLDECKVGIGKPKETRHAPRLLTSGRVIIKGFGTEPVPMNVRDIAIGGLLALSDQKVSLTGKVDVTVFLEGETKALECRGQVLRCKMLIPGTYEVGIVFSDVKDDHRERLIRYLSRLLSQQAE